MRKLTHARWFFGLAVVLCLAYLLRRYGFFSSSVNVFYAENSSRKVVASQQWLIIDSMTQLERYRQSPSQNKSIIFIGAADYTGAVNQTDVLSVNIEQAKSRGLKTKNTKMLAYLLAIEHGARLIYSNNPNVSFRNDTRHIAFRRQRSPFINVQATFTANFSLYSPGLPKDELLNITQDGWTSIRTVDRELENIQPLIHQEVLVQNDPRLPFFLHPRVAVEPFTFAPFSNDNTLFAYDAFWGLALSESKSEIWRSWWVQRLLWDIQGHLTFGSSAHDMGTTPADKANIHAAEEKNTGNLVRFLAAWRSTKTSLADRIEQLVTAMVQQAFADSNDLTMIRAWLDDLKRIKYEFPAIKKVSREQSVSGKPRRRRVAVCMTGLVECIEEAWRPTARSIQSRIRGDMDVFMYLSSTEPLTDQLSTVPLRTRLIEALQYDNFTVKVIFEDIPKLDPYLSANCTTEEGMDLPPHKVPRYYKQLLGLVNCFALVRDYEAKHNIKYDLMVRARGDIEFLRAPSTFDRPSPHNINQTVIIPPNRYASKVDDGFAIGPIDKIEVYMNRYFSFQQCITKDLHPERYLHFYLNYRNVSMTIDQGTLVGSIPHGPKRCH